MVRVLPRGDLFRKFRAEIELSLRVRKRISRPTEGDSGLVPESLGMGYFLQCRNYRTIMFRSRRRSSSSFRVASLRPLRGRDFHRRLRRLRTRLRELYLFLLGVRFSRIRIEKTLDFSILKKKGGVFDTRSALHPCKDIQFTLRCC